MAQGCKYSKAVTLLLRGANDYMLDEMDRSIHDSLCVVKRVLESGSVVAGARGHWGHWGGEGVGGKGRGGTCCCRARRTPSAVLVMRFLVANDERYVKPQITCLLCAPAGGGAVEAALSIFLENHATTLGSREQLAIGEFANSLLVLPKTLAVNAAKDATELVRAAARCFGRGA